MGNTYPAEGSFWLAHSRLPTLQCLIRSLGALLGGGPQGRILRDSMYLTLYFRCHLGQKSDITMFGSKDIMYAKHSEEPKFMNCLKDDCIT